MTTTTTSTQRSHLYTRVTERVVADLECGAKPVAEAVDLVQRRHHLSPPAQRDALRGINVLLPWGEAIDRGYSAPLWMTYRQALELGGTPLHNPPPSG
jgi:antirestriction protein ArdC